MKLISWILVLTALPVLGEDLGFRYDQIAKRYSDTALGAKEAQAARMQGECLVGLKELNFKRSEEFDAVAEWTNYRTISLLQHYSPCEVLIIMEEAKKRLRESQ